MVASAPSQGPPLWPSCLSTVLGVKADYNLPPDAVAYVPGAIAGWRAYGRPRPLPGAAQAQNYQGSSFAAARISGILAREAATRPIRDRESLLTWLRQQAMPLPASDVPPPVA